MKRKIAITLGAVALGIGQITAGTVKATDINTGRQIELTSPEITPTPTPELHTTIIVDGNNQRIGEVRWTRTIDPDGTIRLTLPTRDLSAGASKTSYLHVIGTIAPTGNWPLLVCAAGESPPNCSTTSPPDGTGQCDRWASNVVFDTYLVVPCPPTNFSTIYRYYMNGIQVGQWNINRRSFAGNCKDGYVSTQTTPVFSADCTGGSPTPSPTPTPTPVSSPTPTPTVTPTVTPNPCGGTDWWCACVDNGHGYTPAPRCCGSWAELCGTCWDSIGQLQYCCCCHFDPVFGWQCQ